MHQQGAGLDRFVRPWPALEVCRHATGEVARGLGALATLLAEAAQPIFQIDGVAAKALLGQHDGEQAGRFALTFFRRRNRHGRKARRQGQIADLASPWGQRAGAVERSEVCQQFSRFRQRRFRWRIDEGKSCGIADAPVCHVEQQP
ncbi:hypothetical protein D3C87_1777590 [compost metagenome]